VSSRYEGRHRGHNNGRRIPQSLRAGFALPTAAAATLVVTATGATVAQSAPINLDLTGVEAARTRAANAAFERAEDTQRRQQFELKVSAARARVQEEQRASRDRARKAVERRKAAAEAQAKAKAAAVAAAEKERRERHKWVEPVAGATFTSGFGWRWGRMHNGNDFATPVGTPIVAMSSGTVTFVGQDGGYGNKIEIEYWDGSVSWYAHLNDFNVTVGQQVSPGDLVGHTGNTGSSTGPHLHLEIHPNGGPAINPAPWLLERNL
jgi:murein DD-endopeptidase MepM/ murein hydrolase activator NlpD